MVFLICLNRRRPLMWMAKGAIVPAIYVILLTSGTNMPGAGARQNPFAQTIENQEYPGVPRSTLYEVTVTESNASRSLVVFQSSCPEYRPGYMNLRPVDQYPFKLFTGRTISWVNFSFSKSVTIQVRVLDPGKIPSAGSVKILPSRLGLTPFVNGNTISFTVNNPRSKLRGISESERHLPFV